MQFISSVIRYDFVVTFSMIGAFFGFTIGVGAKRKETLGILVIFFILAFLSELAALGFTAGVLIIPGVVFMIAATWGFFREKS